MASDRGSTGHRAFSSYEKTSAVLRLLKGEPAEQLSEELGVSIRRLERWRSDFVAAGSAELSRRRDLDQGWFKKHGGTILQWSFLILILIGVIALISVYSQR